MCSATKLLPFSETKEYVYKSNVSYSRNCKQLLHPVKMGEGGGRRAAAIQEKRKPILTTEIKSTTWWKTKRRVRNHPKLSKSMLFSSRHLGREGGSSYSDMLKEHP